MKTKTIRKMLFFLTASVMLLASIMGASADTISIGGNISGNWDFSGDFGLSKPDIYGDTTFVAVEYELNFSIPVGTAISSASAGIQHTNEFHTCYPPNDPFYVDGYYFIGSLNWSSSRLFEDYSRTFGYSDYPNHSFNCFPTAPVSQNAFSSWANANQSVLLKNIVQNALGGGDDLVLFYTSNNLSVDGSRGIEDDFSSLTISYYGFNLSARLTPLIPDYDSGLIVNVSVTDNETLQDSPIEIEPVEVTISWFADGVPTTCGGGCPVQISYVDNTGFVVVDNVDASYLEPDVEYSVDVEVNNMDDIALDDNIIGDPVFEEETSNTAEGTQESLNPCGNGVCDAVESSFSCASDCFSGSGSATTSSGSSYIGSGLVGTGLDNLYTGQILTINGAIASGVPSYSSWSFIFINRIGVGGSLI